MKPFTTNLKELKDIRRAIAKYCIPKKIDARIGYSNENAIEIYFKGHQFAGLQIIYFVPEKVFEFSEYMAGEKENELHVFGEYKTINSALRRFLKGKNKPVKVWQ